MEIYIYIYIYYLLHTEQLHVSALDNIHVVYETLSKQLYKTRIWATYMGQGGGKVGEWWRYIYPPDSCVRQNTHSYLDYHKTQRG